MFFAGIGASHNAFVVFHTFKDNRQVVCLGIEVFLISNPAHVRARVAFEVCMNQVPHMIIALCGVNAKCSAKMRTHAGLSTFVCVVYPYGFIFSSN